MLNKQEKKLTAAEELEDIGYEIENYDNFSKIVATIHIYSDGRFCLSSDTGDIWWSGDNIIDLKKAIKENQKLFFKALKEIQNKKKLQKKE